MSLLQEAKDRLGELFIMGFNGLELNAETEAFISQAQIGGVILFGPNYENPAQVSELINQIQSCRRDLPLWISVDHEGGKVQRFKKPFTKIPDAVTLSKSGSPKTVFDVSDLIARELGAVGINVNFAPVADINTNPKNPVIGNRAFGASEEDVSKMVTAFVRGHLLQKIQPCVKHFPGHGDTHQDSHLALPKVDTPLSVLKEREFRPFTKAFKSHCNMVMTAHMICKDIDPDFPATLSSKILKDILRNEMRYQKLIISDDLEMKAITDHFGAKDAPRLALLAGCDLLIYRTEAGTRAAYGALTQALEDGTLSHEVVLTASSRSQEIKREVLMPFVPIEISQVFGKIGTSENLALVKKIQS